MRIVDGTGVVEVVVVVDIVVVLAQIVDLKEMRNVAILNGRSLTFLPLLPTASTTVPTLIHCC